MLKKCPICGGSPVSRTLLCAPPKYQIHCSTADCQRSVIGMTPEDAEEKWNEIVPEKKVVPPERGTILAIIDDAMQNRDRYVQLFFGKDGVAVTVYPLNKEGEE